MACVQHQHARIDIRDLCRTETRGRLNLCRVTTAHRRIQRRVGTRLDDDRHYQCARSTIRVGHRDGEV